MITERDIEVLENLAAEKLGTPEVEVNTTGSGKVYLIVAENPFRDSDNYYLGNEGADCYEVRHNGEKPSTFDDLKAAICEVAEAREREEELEEIADCMRAGNFSEEEIADCCAAIAQCARGERHPSGDWGACTCKGRRYLIEYEN